ncbi:MAG TPA: glycoside hydrolase family 15 protein [Solirubrobacteraceae bacterium]|nr:glycoside hydrolase family 15 protein [Solirubrobacteraceae bacterium]
MSAAGAASDPGAGHGPAEAAAHRRGAGERSGRPGAPRERSGRPGAPGKSAGHGLATVAQARSASPSQASPFPPIADYGFLSDCHTGALVASDGSIEWMCLPHFDSKSVFGAMLDRGAGSFRVGPYGTYVPAGRRYVPGTNLIETTWMTPQGWLRVIDGLTIGAWHDNKQGTSHTRAPTDFDADHLLVRWVECVQGQVPFELVCEPMFDYGVTPAQWSVVDTGEEGGYALDASDGEMLFRLYSDMRTGIEGNRVHARHTMVEGEQRFCAISWTEARGGPRTAEQAKRCLDGTSHFWRTWLADGTYPDHPWRYHLQRSALTLKGLTFMPTGALVAAPTTSLPETPRGERNWDYRYCWMRDASFTLWGLHALGLDWEADDFVQYVADLRRNEDGSLQIMYGISGEMDLEESTLEHLKGYEGARPVRIGNGAYNQRQNDVYGAVLDSVYLHSKQRDHIPERLWPVLIDQVRCAERVWKQPDQGIWEARGEPRHYVSSKLMCWVAMDRGARLAERRGEQELAEQWQALADEIGAEILDRGVDGRGVFRQHYETDALDASNLLVGLVRFLPPEDERVRATVSAIKRELTENGLVLRYRTDQTDDGQRGEEGTFLICSFWLVSALSEIGEHREAEHLCERLLSYSSPLGLYAEEMEASSGRQLGNYPQAFTHLALINAVTHVIAAQQG